MNEISRIDMPENPGDLPGISHLNLIRAMCAKNDFRGLPVYTYAVDGETVGMAIVDPDAYPLYAKLWALEVRADVRGKGIGSALVRRVLEEYDDVRLVAMRDAFDFYLRNGFIFQDGQLPDPKSNVAYMESRQ